MSAHPTDLKKDQLLRLSDEVSRIAGTLARLSARPEETRTAATASDTPELSPETVRAVIRARQQRARYLPPDLFAEPAWDIMLSLLHAEMTYQRVSTSNACEASGVPATTALRWLNAMTKKGLVLRRQDPHDGRRVYVELAPSLSNSLRRYFAETQMPSSI